MDFDNDMIYVREMNDLSDTYLYQNNAQTRRSPLINNLSEMTKFEENLLLREPSRDGHMINFLTRDQTHTHNPNPWFPFHNDDVSTTSFDMNWIHALVTADECIQIDTRCSNTDG